MKNDIKQDKAMAKKAVGMHEKQLHGGKKSDLAALKKGGKVMKYAEGGTVTKTAQMKTTKDTDYAKLSREEKEKVQLKNARAKNPQEFDKMKSMYDSALKNEGYKKGGKVKCMAKGGGIEVRGKTRGKMC
jgi:hypothetical protein